MGRLRSCMSGPRSRPTHADWISGINLRQTMIGDCSSPLSMTWAKRWRGFGPSSAVRDPIATVHDVLDPDSYGWMIQWPVVLVTIVRQVCHSRDRTWLPTKAASTRHLSRVVGSHSIAESFGSLAPDILVRPALSQIHCLAGATSRLTAYSSRPELSAGPVRQCAWQFTRALVKGLGSASRRIKLVQAERDGWGSLSAGQLGASAAELKEGLAARDSAHRARGVAEL